MSFRSLSSLLPFAIALVITVFLQKTIINDPEGIRVWLASWGTLTLIVYALLQFVTIVVAPLGGFALVIAIFALFGPWTGAFIVYFVTTPAYILNFYLAKKYGRPVVRKVIGVRNEHLIEKFTNHLDLRMLVLLKLLMNGYFDYISYAAGLSTISLTQFSVVNVMLGIPGLLIMAMVLSLSPSFTVGIGVLYALPVITGAVYLVIIRKKWKSIKNLIGTPHEV